jgi:ABC-type molybdate transport system ATPase subunit
LEKNGWRAEEEERHKGSLTKKNEHIGPCFQNAQLFYYIMLSNVVQFGWGAVQISHLAMITELVRPELVLTIAEGSSEKVLRKF